MNPIRANTQTFMLLISTFFIYTCSSKIGDRQKQEPVIEQAPQVIEKDSTAPIAQEDTTTELKDKLYFASIDLMNYDDQLKCATPIIDTITTYDDHWLLKLIARQKKIYSRDSIKYSEKLNKLPKSKDLARIAFIRQAAFHYNHPNTKEYILEEWHFENQEDSEKWFHFLKDSLRGAYFTKPPRYQWIDDQFIYLISARSAAHWFTHKDSLHHFLNGKTISQARSLTNVNSNWKYIKKSLKGAHSSTIKMPEGLKSNATTHMSYYYFTAHRSIARKYTQREFLNRDQFMAVTAPLSTLTGDEKYESIKEELVCLKYSIEQNELGNLNIINKNIAFCNNLFGKPYISNKNRHIYRQNTHYLVCDLKDGTVKEALYFQTSNAFIHKEEDLLTFVDKLLKCFTP